MKKSIKPKLIQWLWFVALWCLGVGSMLLISLPIKLLLKTHSA